MTQPSLLHDQPADGRFDLHSGALRLALRVDLGASIAGLWHRDLPVLDSVEPTDLTRATEAACFAQLPFAHLLGQHRFRFKGREWSVAAHPGDGPHALNGMAWRRPWRLVSHTAQDAVLRLVHAPDADWPFAFEALQHINLTPNALGVQLVLTNTDPQVQPVGLGWSLRFPKRSRSRLHIEVGQRWESEASGLPTRRVSQPGVDGDVAHLDFDHAFEAWTGPARLRDERLSLQLRASTPHLSLRSRPDEASFTISPSSQVPNAIHMADPVAHGVRCLEPGDSTELSMSLDVAVL